MLMGYRMQMKTKRWSLMRMTVKTNSRQDLFMRARCPLILSDLVALEIALQSNEAEVPLRPTAESSPQQCMLPVLSRAGSTSECTTPKQRLFAIIGPREEVFFAYTALVTRRKSYKIGDLVPSPGIASGPDPRPPSPFSARRFSLSLYNVHAW